MWIYLSHPLSENTPSYAGGPGLTIKPHRQIVRGDSSNSYIVTLLNHLGTHVDAPNHFSVTGRSISSYRPEELFFTSPALVDIPKRSGELLSRSELSSYERVIAGADLLLVRTGFQRYRVEEPERYASLGPCLSAEAAHYLAGFPGLRAVGFDMISISSPLHRDEGRAAHRVLLVERGILIVEDMDLMGKPRELKRVVVAPLMIEGVDSAPCTVLAEV
ncbi:Kynurenine formamidase [archaeon HR01]|nr:Kynurenine formamidase [archaeon HR01]